MANYLVIAASSAIGQAVVNSLISQGDTVFTTARDNSKIEPNALLDATDFDAVNEVFKQASSIDGVVNCAGSLLLKSAHTTSQEQYEAIAAAKAGIIGLAQSAASTYANLNLRFNVVAPGMTDTPLTVGLISNALAFKASKEMHALNRIGTPEDIARAIVFLLDPKNNWITGQVLAVDGGLSKVRPKMKM